MTKGAKECLLCGEPASSKYDENYLDGFCDLCIISMKKERKKKAQIESPYDEIFDKITTQVEKIETVVSTILDKIEPTLTSPSSSSKKSSEPKIIKPKKDVTPSAKKRKDTTSSSKPKDDDYTYKSYLTSTTTNGDQLTSNEARKNDSKTKKSKKYNYMPSTTPA